LPVEFRWFDSISAAAEGFPARSIGEAELAAQDGLGVPAVQVSYELERRPKKPATS
jgi:hypothetical protein